VHKLSNSDKPMYYFLVATLISEGEMYCRQNKKGIHFIFSQQKIPVITDYIYRFNLQDQVEIDPQTMEGFIKPHELVDYVLHDWYRENNKQVGTTTITKEAALLSVILFGLKQLEGVAVSTNIKKEYLRSLSFLLERNLSVPVVPVRNKFKIFDVIPLLIDSLHSNKGLIEITEIANMLTDKEKKQLEYKIEQIQKKGIGYFV
jgi:hypothetical protein